MTNSSIEPEPSSTEISFASTGRRTGADALDAAARRYRLSPRERDVLRLLLAGASTPDIAVELAIGGETVRDHVKNLLRKTGTRNRVELAGRALGYQAEEAACPSW